MNPVDLLMVAAVAIAMFGYVVGYRTGRCSATNPCSKCAFHTNEQRMARLREEEARVRYHEDQERLEHDYMHKGGGFLPGDPDKFPCRSTSCARNPKGVDSSQGGK